MDPLVSVSCITFNHKSFIKDCLEGILSQKTNFPIEILIHDDASTDGTTDIIAEYQQKYPHIIKPLIQKKNQWSQGVRGINAKFNYPRAKGKYIALCEGDDYWADPLKLQKQVNFLKDNREFVLSFHDCTIIDEKGRFISNSKLGADRKSDLSKKQMISGSVIPTLSATFRNLPIVHKMPKEIFRVKNGDTFLFAILGQFGKAHFHTDIKPAVYRVHEGGVWSKKSKLENLKSGYITFCAISKTIHQKYRWSSKNIALVNLMKIKPLDEVFYRNEIKKFSFLRRLYVKARTLKTMK